MVETKKVILGCMANPSAGDDPSIVGIIAHPCTVTPKVAHHETVRLKMRVVQMDLLLPGDDPDVLEVVAAASGGADGDHEVAALVLAEESTLKVNQEQVTVAIKEMILDPPVNQEEETVAVPPLPLLSLHHQK